MYLLFNPPLDSCILTPLDGFPVIVRDGRVAIDHSQIPHLSGPPSIRLVMKAIREGVYSAFYRTSGPELDFSEKVTVPFSRTS